MTSKTALIIDDERDVATYLGSVLSEHGWQVRTTHSGDTGLAMAREERPDVILLDLMMPGGRGGLSTFLALRKDGELRSIPVVFVTAYREPAADDPESFLARHPRFRPDGYVEKPVDPDHLIAVVEKAHKPTRDVDDHPRAQLNSEF
jgi:CheY-like chemotaxis protein